LHQVDNRHLMDAINPDKGGGKIAVRIKNTTGDEHLVPYDSVPDAIAAKGTIVDDNPFAAMAANYATAHR
jgi:hypothetical protein